VGPLVTHAGRDILHTDDYDTFLPMSDAAEGRDSVRKLKDWGATAVKVWYLAPSEERRATLDEAIMAVGNEARTQGLPLIVHATTVREAKVAIRAGASLLVHSIFSEDVDDEFIQLVVDNDVIYTPTIVVGPNWTQAVTSVTLGTPNQADDPNGCVDPGTRAKIANVAAFAPYLSDTQADEEQARESLAGIPARLDQAQRNLKRLYDAGATIVTGTDAGNPLTLHGPSIYAEMEAMQDAGVPAAEVIVMSTRNGARAMDRLDDFGTLEPGKIADLLVLGGDPAADVANFRKIESVMRAGVMHAVSELSFDAPE
jgi:imidazolonepropionase-like amidohydrolase